MTSVSGALGDVRLASGLRLALRAHLPPAAGSLQRHEATAMGLRRELRTRFH